jgi:hypothetical protein
LALIPGRSDFRSPKRRDPNMHSRWIDQRQRSPNQLQAGLGAQARIVDIAASRRQLYALVTFSHRHGC